MLSCSNSTHSFFHGYRQNMVILNMGEGFSCQSRPSMQERRESLLLPSTLMLVDQAGAGTFICISLDKWTWICPSSCRSRKALHGTITAYQLPTVSAFPSSSSSPKIQSASSTQGYTRGLQNISKQIDLSLRDLNLYFNFFLRAKNSWKNEEINHYFQNEIKCLSYNAHWRFSNQA